MDPQENKLHSRLNQKGFQLLLLVLLQGYFFRNSVNVGMPVIEVPNHKIEKGDSVEVNLSQGTVLNLTTKEEYQGTVMPDIMIRIFEEGGLDDYLKKYKSYQL
ncbi:3-isopropylmalate dehydratase small subunit [Geomicrobium sp. JCM 19055]|nr:3-isopropylmalate dehydratase small subunit [Geomicrobium sp. JCM 19055]